MTCIKNRNRRYFGKKISAQKKLSAVPRHKRHKQTSCIFDKADHSNSVWVMITSSPRSCAKTSSREVLSIYAKNVMSSTITEKIAIISTRRPPLRFFFAIESVPFSYFNIIILHNQNYFKGLRKILLKSKIKPQTFNCLRSNSILIARLRPALRNRSRCPYSRISSFSCRSQPACWGVFSPDAAAT